MMTHPIRRLHRARRLMASIVACGVAACAGPAKREASSLVSAVDRYQHAELAQKPTAANDVRAAVATDPEVAAAKQACLAAIDPTVKALELKREVEKGLDDLEQGRTTRDDPAARALPAKLDESERLLKDGRAQMKSCEERILALRSKHGV